MMSLAAGNAPYVQIGMGVCVLAAVIFLVFRAIYNRRNSVMRRKLDLHITAFTTQIRREPNNETLLVKRGVARYKKNDVSGAINDFTQAIELRDDFTEAHYNRGIAFDKCGKNKEAMQDFEWVLNHSEDPYYKTAVKERLSGRKA